MSRQIGRKRKPTDSAAIATPKVAKTNEVLAPPRVGLNDLPLELLHVLFVEARSTSLPLVNRQFWQCLICAPDAVRFEYLAGLWEDLQISQVYLHKCPLASPCPTDGKPRNVKGLEEQRQQPIDRRKIDPTLPPLFTCCEIDDDLIANLYTFVTSFAVCTRSVLSMFIKAAGNHWRSNNDRDWDRISPSIPKRLFRSLRTPKFEPRSAERQFNDNGTKVGPGSSSTEFSFVSSSDPNSISALGHQFLESLTLPKTKGADIIDEIGPVPSPEQFDMVLDLLKEVCGNPNSYDGFPLVMAVHRRAYALMNLLMLYGADPAKKGGLAIQIAINNGDLHAIRVMASPRPDLVSLSQEKASDFCRPIRRRPAQFMQDHLQLAIYNKQWAIVDFLFEDKRVVPDMACLRLIEKYRK